jgi:proteasome accessory factor B
VSTSKSTRWLDLVAFLLDRRYPVSREQIFAKVGGYDGEPESARRKFERDKDELRALGIEIETVPLPGTAGDEPGTGYRLRPRNAYLPYLELVDEPAPDRPYPGLDRLALSKRELEILDRATRSLAALDGTPLAAAAASARRKLSFDLPFTADAAQRVLGWPVPEHARQALAVLQDAVIDHTAVSCRYYTMSRRSESVRELEPWGLMFQWGRWYCVARARDRDDARVFRVDRMRDVKRATGPGATFDVPDDFDIRRLAYQAPWEFGSGPVTKVQVAFSFPESRWVANRGLGRVLSEESPQTTTMEFDVRDEDAFLRWLLSFGRKATINEPTSLRATLETLRADVAALYVEAVS